MVRWSGRESTGTWTIVLAGGKGQRLRSFTERWLGRYVPKQYCAFVGERSMLQHTLDRARFLSRPEDIVTVVAEEHRELAAAQVAPDLSGGLLLQPEDRDTAAGVFLPLAHVMKRRPDARVVIFPADHFIHPERRFIETVRAAVRAVDDVADKMVLLGVQPDGPEEDYGWIVPGKNLSSSQKRSVQAVRSFVEKPSAAVVAAARVRGGLWNTMVIAARAETLWQIGRRYVPDVVEPFERWLAAGGDRESLSSMYRSMPRRNFSSELLERAHRQVAVVELDGLLWSDWGREERILETLERIGARPSWAPTLAPTRSTPLPGALQLSVAQA